jgi:hypothetical protein
MAGITDAFQMSCVMTAVGVVAIIANSCVISKFGRRRVFLMVGMSICGVSQFIIAAVYRSDPGTANTGRVSRPSEIPISKSLIHLHVTSLLYATMELFMSNHHTFCS